MSLRNYFDKRKAGSLEWVTDWTDPQNHIRNEKDVNKLSYWDWFYCHPTSYALINYGSNAVGILFFTMACIYLFIKGAGPLIFVLGILDSLIMYDLYKKLKQREYTKDITFYDIWMREYFILDKEEDKNEDDLHE